MEPTQPLIQWTQGTLFPGIKRTGREADRPLQSNAELNYARSYTPIPFSSSWRSASLNIGITLLLPLSHYACRRSLSYSDRQYVKTLV
jgi:hypothetical protein